jgi:hypothetical protein
MLNNIVRKFIIIKNVKFNLNYFKLFYLIFVRRFKLLNFNFGGVLF